MSLFQDYNYGLTRVTLYADGASRGNPGPAGVGVVMLDSVGRVVMQLSHYVGQASNNVAEYLAVIAALESARWLKCESVVLRSDSELLTRQLRAEYRVRQPHLRELYGRVMKLAAGFKSVEVEHVAREDNSLADSLANRAIDCAAGRPDATPNRRVRTTPPGTAPDDTPTTP